ncbi:unannotated protein [freshwater metagenome]|uniref:Unannotated protein n=1 Tax=freshwater metagenome TaxID=449393 RepID=A0A6J6XCJ8_9ZZZZ
MSGLAGSDIPLVSGGAPAEIRFLRVNLPLLHHHSAAHGTEQIRDVILVSWQLSDGTVGWGECPTLSSDGYVTESTERAWVGLTTQLGPAVLRSGLAAATSSALSIGSAGSAGSVGSAVSGGLIASAAALADASLDARLRSEGRSLLEELLSLSGSPPTGERPIAKQALSRCAVIADLGASPTKLAELASEAAEGGAAMVKIKIAPGHDVEELLAVRAAIGDLPLAADANGSYAGLSEILAVDALGLVFLEQPFPAGLPWEELAGLRSSMLTPLALDESLSSIDAVKCAVLAGAVDVVSVKPARLGGMRAAALAVETASSAGLGVFVGGMLELGIGRAGATAVAALPGCNLPTDLGPSQQYVDSDICDPINVNPAGELILPTGPGIGRVPREEQLQQFCVEEFVLN